jgi:fructokinase
MTAAAQDRALVVGEALIDEVVRPDGSRERHPGGSPANVAIGLGRLGRSVDLLTWLGDDADGDLVRRHLGESHVHVLTGDRRATRTPVATATIDAAGVASYQFDLEWDLPSTWDGAESAPLVVHTGSIATVLQPGGTAVERLVSRSRPSSTITYDPNLRPVLMGSPAHALPVVDALVRLADVVKVSDEDLAWLHPGVAPAEIAEEWSRSGPSLVVVTHGGEGAFASTSAGARISVEAPAVQVADTVGAGDSFMGGLIDGLWSAGLLGAGRRQALADVDAGTVQAVLERCARIAAITVSRAGANPPRLAELS